MSENVSEVYSLVLPTLTDGLLLPNVTVAEIVPFIDVSRAVPGGKPWYLGELNWRGARIPMVSLEVINGEEDEVDPTRRSRVAVMYTLNGNKELPYIGILVQGIPRLAHVIDSEIHALDEQTGPGTKMKVGFSGQKLIIPDLDELERMIKTVERKVIEK